MNSNILASLLTSSSANISCRKNMRSLSTIILPEHPSGVGSLHLPTLIPSAFNLAMTIELAKSYSETMLSYCMISMALKSLTEYL